MPMAISSSFQNAVTTQRLKYAPSTIPGRRLVKYVRLHVSEQDGPQSSLLDRFDRLRPPVASALPGPLDAAPFALKSSIHRRAPLDGNENIRLPALLREREKRQGGSGQP